MSNGKTKPCLLSCEREDGSEIELVAKFSAGCERGVGGLVVEAIAAMLAADLELPVPEPYLVSATPEFCSLISDDQARALALQSSVVAFGSALLPPSFSVWIHTKPLPPELQQQALEIFAFDAFLMNADRVPRNPNCQANGRTFAMFDHELCFLPPLFQPLPWVVGGLEYTKSAQAEHLFRRGLQGAPLNLDRFAGALEAVNDDRIDSYLLALPDEWSQDGGAGQQAVDHIHQLKANMEAAITEVIRVLT